METQKVNMKDLKFAKKKPITKTKAKKKAWDAFSLYIRTSNLKDGLVECYTCGNRRHLKEMSAGHAIGGRNNAILFDERIVKPQCAGCNIWGRGQYQIFAYKLIKELGMGVYEGILAEAQEPVQYKVYNYQAIELIYKKKLAELFEDSKDKGVSKKAKVKKRMLQNK